jgi:hypothetical protein
MTTGPLGKNLMDLNDRADDDLTTIKGIGPARQQWLRESLGVRTFQDLTALSADEIESQLKAEGQVASRREIDGWLAQARELAATAQSSSQRVAELAGTVGGAANSPPEEGGWRPFASFVVEFQASQVEGRTAEQRTTVHYMEVDRSKTWPGIEGKQLCQWILGQLGEEAQREPEPEEAPPVEARRAAASSLTVEINQIQAFQPPQAEMPIGIGRAGHPFSGFVRSDEPFTLEVSFALAGPDAAEVTKEQVTYRAQFYARNRPTGERTHLGDTKAAALVAGKVSSYTATLPKASLEPGAYRLWALVTLQSRPPCIGHLEMPLLQVT